jgi:Flp pilus assembly pilin Flp
MTGAMGQMASRKSQGSRYPRGWMDRRRRLRQAGQALIEYSFLFVVLATITIAVIFLAGTQVRVAFNDVSYDINHMGTVDTTTASPHLCTDGDNAVFRHNKWRCKDE